MTPIVDPAHAWYTKTYITPIVKKYSGYGRLFTNSWSKTWTSKYFDIEDRYFSEDFSKNLKFREKLLDLPEVKSVKVSEGWIESLLVHLDPKLVKERYNQRLGQSVNYTTNCRDCVHLNTHNYDWCKVYCLHANHVPQSWCNHSLVAVKETAPEPIKEKVAVKETAPEPIKENTWIECVIKPDACGDYCFDHPSIYGATRYFSERHNVVGYAGTLYDGMNGEWKLAFSTPLIGDIMPKPLKVRFLASSHPYQGPKPEDEITFEAMVDVMGDFDGFGAITYLDMDLPDEIQNKYNLKSGKYQVTLSKITEDKSRPTGKDRNLE